MPISLDGRPYCPPLARIRRRKTHAHRDKTRSSAGTGAHFSGKAIFNAANGTARRRRPPPTIPHLPHASSLGMKTCLSHRQHANTLLAWRHRGASLFRTQRAAGREKFHTSGASAGRTLLHSLRRSVLHVLYPALWCRNGCAHTSPFQ